ncbi:7964_t:CDS:2 [Racocetra persica]|uniref:7964_t:CDS:1 n=1 Tax=Racocetra persica TaxID=160502 RepID=A0ACA9R9Q0_9GLOM|nr:7964_t:CDS:2 [Racocetra persica]
MNVKGTKSLVIASLEDVTVNLPQDNDLARVKKHGATKGCHIQFNKILATSTIMRYKAIAAEYGLHIKPPILDKLKRERHLQSPHDIYHVIARKILRFFKITIDALCSVGKSEFIIFWKLFDYPKS